MRLLSSLAYATALLVTNVSTAAVPSDALRETAIASSTLQSRASNFSSPSGRLFNIDGKVQYFAGTNAWWLGHLTSDDDLEVAMSEIAESGLKVVRVWGFGNVNEPTNETVYFQLLNSSAGSTSASINYGANGIPRLDAVVASAEKYNVQLVLAMLNNWADLGGQQTYCNVFGCNTTSDPASFYTNTAVQKAYTDYISFVVNRYKTSSAIFSWELCNEPRCHNCSTSVIYDWATTTSAFIKSIDADHMVTLGDEGWLCGGGDGSYAYSCIEGVDFQLNLGIPTLDYGTFHQYPDQWGYNYSWGNEWETQHDAIGKTVGKPVVLEEYGAQGANTTAVEGQWQNTVVDDTEIAYDSFWQFGTMLPSGTMDTDNYTIYFGTSEYQILVTEHVSAMAAKAV